jgi:signal transduction histidine kinase
MALASGASCGLSGMHERAALLGGRMTVKSQRGAGTVVTFEVPISEPIQEAAQQRSA